MKLVKKGKTEPKYFVPEIAQAIGVSESSIRGFYSNRNKSTKGGLTLEEIVAVVERARKRGEGIDWSDVKEIRRRLSNEYGYIVVDEEEAAE